MKLTKKEAKEYTIQKKKELQRKETNRNLTFLIAQKIAGQQ